MRELLTRHAPGSWQVSLHDNHPTIRDIPASHAGLPIFGLIRNPFDWYVSWYHYLKAHRTDPFFDLVSQQGQLGFKPTIEAAFEVDISEMFHFPCHFRKSPYGCYMNYIFGNDLELLHLGKMESLRSDLRRFLESCSSMTDQLDQQLDAFPVVNQSVHQPYRSYYNDALRELVLERDREVLERFDYHF